MNIVTPEQHILTIVVLAAFADGQKADAERSAIRQIAEGMDKTGGDAALTQVYQSVLLGRVGLADAVAGLIDIRHKQLAYEMAVCVCNADGLESPAESAFLSDLRGRLALRIEAIDQLQAPAKTLAEVVERASPAVPIPPIAPPPVGPTPGVVIPADPSGADTHLDQTIMNHALVCGALELLPQSWASMAIIPVQIKLVYAVGQAYGIALDQGHIREFIAAAGIGAASQYIEQFGRKLIGGLLGRAAGRTIERLGGTATGMALSFATTYALGQIAKRYYAGGRVMNTAVVRQSFQDLLQPAKQLQTQHMPQIEQIARNLDASKVMAMVRGSYWPSK